MQITKIVWRCPLTVGDRTLTPEMVGSIPPSVVRNGGFKSPWGHLEDAQLSHRLPAKLQWRSVCLVHRRWRVRSPRLALAAEALVAGRRFRNAE